jgi:hypothetical protein
MNLTDLRSRISRLDSNAPVLYVTSKPLHFMKLDT